MYVEDSKIDHHPYSIRLNTLLNSTSVVIESGVNGEQTKSMIRRLNNVLPNSNAKIVIILGGTNDINHNFVPSKITNNIIHLYKIALNSKIYLNSTVYTVAITIPPMKGWKEVNDKVRLDINKEIKQYAMANKELVALLDLENVFDSTNSTNNLKYWSTDLVHFSKLGYDEIANMLFETLVNFFNNK
jgi:lysophospholipase L1-like esterase